MDTDKTHKQDANLHFSALIEQERIKQGVLRTQLSKAMGIDRTTYTRKINSFNGFTELELLRAMRYLNIKLYRVLDEEIKPLQA